MLHLTKHLSTLFSLIFLLAIIPQAKANETTFLVENQTIPEMKAVYATVESVNQVQARARIGGTVAALTIDEGSIVTAGDVIAVVGDNKIALEMTVLEAQISSLSAQVADAERDLNRARNLRQSGTVAQAFLDNARTAHDVIQGQLAALEGQHAIAAQQLVEGEVLAPATGIVLSVPITNGTVVLAGDSLATMAVESYILRLRLPERHARFLTQNSTVLVGNRGDLSGDDTTWREGQVTLIYPQLIEGRVIADVTIEGLDEFLVGERLRVRVPTGERETLLIPSAYIFTRYGMDFTLLHRPDAAPLPIVVQIGQSNFPQNMTEILSGLTAGDRILLPQANTAQ